MPGMKIDFNNVRVQACVAHDWLIDLLNNSRAYEGYLLVDPNKLEKVLNDLRRTIGAIAMSYEEGDADIKNVYEELYPSPKKMAVFKFEEDEQN